MFAFLDLGETEYLKVMAALNVIGRLYLLRQGYLGPRGEFPTSRHWVDGSIWENTPQEFSDILLQYCEQKKTAYAILLSQAPSWVLRNVPPEKAELLFQLGNEGTPTPQQALPGLFKVRGFKGHMRPYLEALKEKVHVKLT